MQKLTNYVGLLGAVSLWRRTDGQFTTVYYPVRVQQTNNHVECTFGYQKVQTFNVNEKSGDFPVVANLHPFQLSEYENV